MAANQRCLRWRRLATFVVTALVMTSCASTTVQSEASVASNERPERCEDAAGIAELFGSGLPLFDYDPAADISELVDQTDAVITGTLDSVVRIESSNPEISAGSELLTEFRVSESIAYDDSTDDFIDAFDGKPLFYIGSDWPGDDDPLAEPVLFDDGRTRFVAFLTSTGDPSLPWTFGPQGLHVWCSLDDDVHSVIDAVPIGADLEPDTFERAIIDIVDPPEVFDFVDVPARALAEDIAAGEPRTARLVNGLDDINPALADLDLAGPEDDEVLFEFVVSESGTCPAPPFDTLRFDRLSQLFVPSFEPVDRDGDCTSDSRPHLVLVAVARENLPDGDFLIATSTGFPQGLDPTTISASDLAPRN